MFLYYQSSVWTDSFYFPAAAVKTKRNSCFKGENLEAWVLRIFELTEMNWLVLLLLWPNLFCFCFCLFQTGFFLYMHVILICKEIHSQILFYYAFLDICQFMVLCVNASFFRYFLVLFPKFWEVSYGGLIKLIGWPKSGFSLFIV